MITVGELKRILEGYDNSYVVVLTSDYEGNNFSTLEEVVPFAYDTEDNYIYEYSDIEDDECGWETGRYRHALVLWP